MLGEPAPDSRLDEVIFRPVAARNAFEETIERLAHAVKLGAVGYGARFPSERVLAPQLGVSRMTLREALGALEKAGYIETRRGRHGGAYVTYRPDERPSRRTVKAAAARLGDGLEDALVFRRAIEPAAAQIAAERDPDVDAGHLTELAQLAASAPWPQYRGADLRLHAAIAQLTGSPSIVAAVADVQTRLSDLLAAFPVVEASVRHANQQHVTIVRAIQRHDGALARQIMETHVDATANLIRGFLG